MRMKLFFVSLVLGAYAGNATAEITAAGDSGFTSVHEVVVDASRAEAWVAAVEQVGAWWNPDHTISGDATLLSIDARPLGCFCEATAGGVVHLMVTFVNQDVILRMTGGLGPLGLMGVNGNMTWEFFDADGATRIRFAYAVGGYFPEGVNEVAAAVDYVVGEALMHLKAYLDGDG